MYEPDLYLGFLDSLVETRGAVTSKKRMESEKKIKIKAAIILITLNMKLNKNEIN